VPDADRCSNVEAHVTHLQRDSLQELPADAREGVLLAQRSAIVGLAQRDCTLPTAPYSDCVLASVDLASLSLCSGGAR
jgi:hypothetical protein